MFGARGVVVSDRVVSGRILVGGVVGVATLVAACSAPFGGGPVIPPPSVPVVAPPPVVPVGVPPPPVAARGDVVDDYAGTKVPAPYRWMEDVDSAETRAWMAAEAARTDAFLDGLPGRDEIRQRLQELYGQPRFTPPARYGPWWIFRRNDGLQDQAVIYRAHEPDGDGEVVLDPNTLSANGTVAVGAFVPAEDGRLAAYSTSEAGSDWQTWHVLEVATGTVLPDTLDWSKFSGASWTEDGEGFFYVRYPAPPEGAALKAVNTQPQLVYHRVGTAQSEDRVVYERPDQPTWDFAGTVTEDGTLLVIGVGEGTDRRNRVALLDLTQPADEATVQPLLWDFDAAYHFIAKVGDRLLFLTDNAAPLGRVIAVDPAAPEPEHWLEIVPTTPDRLDEVRRVGDTLVALTMHDAHHILQTFSLTGEPLQRPALPVLGSIAGLTGDVDDDVAHFELSSFTQPPAIFGLDPRTGALHTVRPATIPFDATPFVSEQVFFQSKDGTRIPLFLVHRNDLVLDSRHPTLLYGYGGFDISLLPSFSPQIAVWLELGGVYAQPTLRGGGEYGEEWHQAGMLEHKQNVFDDFLAAARYLLRNDYTSPRHLGIFGRSNGGLLVGAALTQAPELFGAAIPEVGVLDMLRYQRFTIGWAWVPEYGSAEDPNMFPVLRAYSPLHNIQPGKRYPATMVMTGDHDDRVFPAHSFKFAAALQHAQAGDAPILLRVETEAGHGGGTPVTKLVDAATDRLAFLRWALR